MDKIRIQNLTVFANHGVLPEERVLGQKFLISAELHLDTRAAGMQDDLTRTVNYALVCSFICQEMQQTFQLIEAAAEHLAQGILREYPLVRRVDLELAKRIEPLEQVIDRIKFKLKKRHIQRLQNGECTIESGFIFSDFITNCERVADHCSNVAVCLIQVAEDSFDTHEYLQNLREHGDVSFDEQYKMYKEKYAV